MAINYCISKKYNIVYIDDDYGDQRHWGRIAVFLSYRLFRKMNCSCNRLSENKITGHVNYMPGFVVKCRTSQKSYEKAPKPFDFGVLLVDDIGLDLHFCP